MKFIVDAQLPTRLAKFLQAAGYDTIHTRNLPQQNATPDSNINAISIAQERIVITKDYDFVDSFLTIQQPYKLLLVTTGNIKNSELEALFADNLGTLVALLTEHTYVEMWNSVVTQLLPINSLSLKAPGAIDHNDPRGEP
jgi:predicted nuclease of predicted toxin-antitoxin system